jgi:hypothetical protein
MTVVKLNTYMYCMKVMKFYKVLWCTTQILGRRNQIPIFSRIYLQNEYEYILAPVLF